MKAVKAINLTKTFALSPLGARKIIALKDISFEIEEKEHLAVMGPSPSGKTTLLKVIAGIYLPDKGDLLIYGNSVRKKARAVRNLTCYMSPQIQLNKKLTVKETLNYFTRILGKKISGEVEELLQSVGIVGENLNNRIETLSDAQLAVLKLAIGLIKEPKILLLDRIFGSLDPKVKEVFTDAIEKVSDQTTLVMVDQEMEILGKFCKKILLLSKDGSMVTMGSVEQLLRNYPYKFDIEVIPKKALSKEILESMGYPYQLMGSLVRFYLTSEEEVLDLTKKLLKIKDKIISFETSSIDVEDVYYWLISKE